MRLINSDSQVCDARVTAKGSGSANSNSLRVELGGFALVAALCIMLVTVGFAIWALVDSGATRRQSEADNKATRELATVQQQAWDRAFSRQQEQARRTETEARVAINEYMEFKAKQESKHGR